MRIANLEHLVAKLKNDGSECIVAEHGNGTFVQTGRFGYLLNKDGNIEAACSVGAGKIGGQNGSDIYFTLYLTSANEGNFGPEANLLDQLVGSLTR